jgi:DNA-directed RNA polymerase subunit RPC12/RpoP
VTLLSKLISIPQSENAKKENNCISCEACGREFETPIHLTNLSSPSQQSYNACPFCFTRLEKDEVLEESNNPKVSTSKNTSVVSKKDEKEPNQATGCPHYLGYLKKRPKNTPIPETCLTCEKMIKCVL